MTAAVLKLPRAPAEPLTLDERAEAFNRDAQSLTPSEIIAAALEEFRGRIALVSSFGAESAALLHLVASVDPATTILFIDTGKHFVQTNAYREELTDFLGLTDVRPIIPDENDASQIDPKGDLWRRNNDACCTLRKVRPLSKALEGFDAWITGRKRMHGNLRSYLPLVEAAHPHIKVNPLARWSAVDLEKYMATHDLPPHPLVESGFSSIGCWPCTAPTAPGDDARAGRWRGLAKTECGIHRL
ncbi:MAG: phosphoadenylyl-sulfate reductase [Pseudomonadota bacterium]